ncbi:MAG: PIN domain-containing protein [Actinomycetia bacterium]|nr:PIN domain-containing protein [Actinomycetes bacterium]
MGSPLNLVLDANIVVDLIKQAVGAEQPAREMRELNAALQTDQYRPVISRHIAEVTATVLRRSMPEESARTGLNYLGAWLRSVGGHVDTSKEDYQELSQRCWKRFGTDTEDEAVLACAERNEAAVVTNDRDFAQYLGDRKITSWSLDSFTAKALIPA